MKNKKGSTIVWAVMLIMVLMVIVGASLSFAYMSYNQSIKNRNKTQAELIANSAIKSLVSVIEDGKIEVPNDTTPKQIKSMELVNTYSNEKNTSYGSISDIYIKRKDENGRLALAYLTAHYTNEDYTIYGYLVYTRNTWKCVQYDTDGNRNIDIKTSGSDDNTGDNTGGNTGGDTGDNTGGSDNPDMPDSSVINVMLRNATIMMDNYYRNDQDLDKYYEWYQNECKTNNAYFSKEDGNPFVSNGWFNQMYNRLYTKDANQSPYLEDSIYTKVKSISSIGFWSSKLYLHVYLIPNSNGDFVITGNQQVGPWNSNGVNLLYIDNKIYVKKSGEYTISDNNTLNDLRNVVNSDEWQELK